MDGEHGKGDEKVCDGCKGAAVMGDAVPEKRKAPVENGRDSSKHKERGFEVVHLAFLQQEKKDEHHDDAWMKKKCNTRKCRKQRQRKHRKEAGSCISGCGRASRSAVAPPVTSDVRVR